MRLRNVLLGAALGMGLLAPSSQAGLEFTPLPGNPGGDFENVLFQEATIGSTVYGHLNQSGIGVRFTTTSDLLSASGGQAVIEGTDGTNQIGLTNVTISIPNGSYTGLIFNPTITGRYGEDGGTLTVTVTPNDGGPFAYVLGPGNNFAKLIATGTTRIVSTTLSYSNTDDGFSSLQQVRIGGVAAVPEPGFVTLVATGLGAMGVCGLRRLRRKQTA